MIRDYIGERFGDYVLVERIGDGGFASVYKGQHVRNKTPAAVKILKQQQVKDFINEVRRTVLLQHPNIIKILDFGIRESDNVAFITMAYAPNGSLREKYPYPPGTRLPLTTVMLYVQQVASALQYAHEQGVIHRDIKPHNLLLDANNTVLLSDFGIASGAATSTFTPAEGEQGVKIAAGTWAYMAPEQFQARPASPASDQYAFALVVYEWLCGEPAFVVSDSRLWSHVHQHVPPPALREKNPSLPIAVEQVVLKALAKQPAERFASVSAFATAFVNAAQTGRNPHGPIINQPNVKQKEPEPTKPIVNEPNPKQPTPTPRPLPKASDPPVKNIDALYEECLRAQGRGEVKKAFQGCQQIVSSRHASANQTEMARNKLQELRPAYVALLTSEAKGHAQAGRWQDTETILGELQQLQPLPSAQELQEIRIPYVAKHVEEANSHIKAGRWRDTEAIFTKLQQLQPQLSAKELQAIHKPYIAKRIEEASKYCDSGNWAAEKKVWQELRRFGPTEQELRGQPIFIPSTGRFTGERETKTERIERRIAIASQNEEQRPLYQRAIQALRRGEKVVAKDYLQNLWRLAPYYGDPEHIAHEIGLTSPPNCEESCQRLQKMLYRNAILAIVLGIAGCILTFFLSAGNQYEIYLLAIVAIVPLVFALFSAPTAYYKTVNNVVMLGGLLVVGVEAVIGVLTGNLVAVLIFVIAIGVLIGLLVAKLGLGLKSWGVGVVGVLVVGLGVELLGSLGAPNPVQVIAIGIFIISLVIAAFAGWASAKYYQAWK